ncbi:CubicO group peptidase (beta-lactamase class C family) [Flavobacteriaceae bacterium MAR_2010_72]|nr:CubicO group peptidase (beta-lactamase class C family) [Flavobacteriaceae bacterium MAR_2010_72]
MLKKIIYLNLILLIVSCNKSGNETKNSEYFRSKIDSIHAQNIEKNLIPMYSIAGKIQRMTIPEMMKQDNIPGMSIAFVDNGEIAWTKHYGFANLEDSIPVSSETVFTGASLSKPITAIAALTLVERGLLNLDEDVNLKLKGWKVPESELTANQKVTLRRLISHNAGIKNDLWSSYLPEQTVPTLNQMLAGEAPSIDPATSVITEPGSKTQYSNPGYSIIQKLLMDVQNQEFDQIIDQLVFDPVGMENSSFKQPIPHHLLQHKAIGYTNELEPYPYRLFPYQAAGGVWTTPKDLSKFMIALLNDHNKGTNILISKETTETIFKKYIDRYVFSFWNWGEDVVFMHYGSNQGFNCIMYGSVNKNQGIVVMTNSDNSFGFFDYIQRAVNDEYQWEYVKPEILNPSKSDISWIHPFLGKYQWRDSKVIITKNNENLELEIDNEKYVLTQTGERVFVLPEKPIKITFPKSIDKSITFWEADGYPFKIKKITK